MCREAGLLPVWLVPSLPVLPDELCRPAAGFPPDPTPDPDDPGTEDAVVEVDEELAAEELAVAEEEALLLEIEYPGIVTIRLSRGMRSYFLLGNQ